MRTVRLLVVFVLSALVGLGLQRYWEYRELHPTTDDAYVPIQELGVLLAGSELLKTFRKPIADLRPLLESGDNEAFIETVSAVSRDIRKVDGTSRIRSQLSKARKAVLRSTPTEATRPKGEIRWVFFSRLCPSFLRTSNTCMFLWMGDIGF